MSEDARRILAELQTVEHERARRLSDPALGAAVAALKSYQQRRFARSYADLLASPRYSAAARFFLDDLYGPKDFSQRDAQFARVVPGLVRLFPHEIVSTVEVLARLHSVSERLDTAMATHFVGEPLDARAYVRAWQLTGQPERRDLQIAYTLRVGRDLDRLTRKPLLRSTLHLMRGPARAAGLPALQQFLEIGFDTFKALGGASEFLGIIEARERELVRALFETPLDGCAGAPALGQLP